MVSSAFSSYLNLKLAGPWNHLDGSYSSKTRTIPLRTVGVVVTDVRKSGIDCFVTRVGCSNLSVCREYEYVELAIE